MWYLIFSVTILRDTDELRQENISEKTSSLTWHYFPYHVISGSTVSLYTKHQKILSFFSKATCRIFLKYWDIVYWLETVPCVLLMWCLESKVPYVRSSFDLLDLTNFQILQLTLHDTEVWAYFLESKFFQVANERILPIF